MLYIIIIICVIIIIIILLLLLYYHYYYYYNTVNHILSGKAMFRAVRGHCIVDASLHSLLAAKVIAVTLPAEITDPDLSTESEDVATTSTGDATKDVESVRTEVTQSHAV